MSDAMADDAVTAPAPHHPLTVKHVLAHLAIIALGLVMLYPVLWMVSSSFKPAQLTFSEPGLWAIAGLFTGTRGAAIPVRGGAMTRAFLGLWAVVGVILLLISGANQPELLLVSALPHG